MRVPSTAIAILSHRLGAAAAVFAVLQLAPSAVRACDLGADNGTAALNFIGPH